MTLGMPWVLPQHKIDSGRWNGTDDAEQAAGQKWWVQTASRQTIYSNDFV